MSDYRSDGRTPTGYLRGNCSNEKTGPDKNKSAAAAWQRSSICGNSSGKDQATFQRLSRVRPGRWTRLEKIGSGATSVVHKGQDSRTGDIIAIKELRFSRS